MKLQMRVGMLLVLTFLFLTVFLLTSPGSDGHHNTHPIQNMNPQMIQRQKQNVTLSNVQERVSQLVKVYDLDWESRVMTLLEGWETAGTWVNHRAIYPDLAPEIGFILRAMSKASILAADVGHRGTQLKLSLVLSGNQKVAFKPKWFERNYEVTGSPYEGQDRHNGEIAAFHLNRILGLKRSPLVVGRVIDLEEEIKPVASEKLLKTFFTKDGNTCFYGKCLYCKSEADGVCADGTKLEGAVVLWLPDKWKFKQWHHPWGRTYKPDKKARWEINNDYCLQVMKSPPYDKGPILLDIFDAAVFDYLIGNADRHHYETFKDYPDSMLIMFDSGKSFGNSQMDELSILAPIFQCCKIRRSTWLRLHLLKEGVLSAVLKEILSKDPIAPVLAESHYKALDRRLPYIIKAIDSCIEKHGKDSVVVVDGDYS